METDVTLCQLIKLHGKQVVRLMLGLSMCVILFDLLGNLAKVL